MLFRCLWRNVETSCHKYFVVLSRHQQTPQLTTSEVSTCGTVVRQRRIDNTWPVAALTARIEAGYWLRIPISAILPTPPAFNAPVRGGGFRRNIVIPFGMEKLEWCGYPVVKKNM